LQLTRDNSKALKGTKYLDFARGFHISEEEKVTLVSALIRANNLRQMKNLRKRDNPPNASVSGSKFLSCLLLALGALFKQGKLNSVTKTSLKVPPLSFVFFWGGGLTCKKIF
jgi:hypothetical protein